LLTAVPDPEGNLTALAKESGCFAYLNKPCKLQLLKDTLEQAFAERNQVGKFSMLPQDQPEISDLQISDSASSPIAETIDEIQLESELETLTSTENTPETALKVSAQTSSEVMTEVEAIIRDPDQLPLQDEDRAVLELEIFSHHYGDLHLNAKTAIRREIENILLRPKTDIRHLSAQEYAAISSEVFVAKGWTNEVPPLQVQGKEIVPFDLLNDRVAFKFGFQSTTLRADFINLQKSYESDEIEFDVAVIVIQTGNSQKYLKKKTKKSWYGTSFNEAVKILKSLQRNIDVPICILGLDISGNIDKYEIEMASYARNVAPVPMDTDGTMPELILGEMSAMQIKECVFDYLQKKYDRAIDRNLRIKSNKGVMGVDGLMKLKMDVLLEIEMGKDSSIPVAKYFTSINEDDIAKSLVDYQHFTGRTAVMRFILLGEFTPGYLQDLSWVIERACKADELLKIDFEVLSFEEIGIRAHDGMKWAQAE
jgi:hypothetical protein